MSDIAIVETRETIFFSHWQGTLRQWILLTIDSSLDSVASGHATIEVCGDVASTSLEILPGVREYRCHAPVVWPRRPPVAGAVVRLAVGDQLLSSPVTVGTHRPWIVYLLSDVCTDYAWNYATEEANRADDAALLEAELAQAEATRHEPEANRNHYNLVQAREVEFFLDRYPHQAERLFDHIRGGTITLNPFFTMAATCDMSLEELIRQFYPARAWALAHNLPLGYANHQETPTITWALASILAGCGIRHLVKSILPYECPWAQRLEEPPIFKWEGPDGLRVLVRRRNEDYVEGSFVTRDLRTTTVALHEVIIPGYERRGDEYPYNAIALVGCYGDLSPSSSTLPAKKSATIAAYNAQGWEYPRLVNASHRQFWDDVEEQIAARNCDAPVFRGDYGTAWDAWQASLAYDFAGWRRAQERAGTADKLAAVLSRLDPEWYAARRPQLAEGWMNLLYLSDHAWNGADDANRALNASMRRRWQTTANQAFDAFVDEGLAALSRHITGAPDYRIAVFNALAWPRSGVARLAAPDGLGDCRFVDLATGDPMAQQAAEEDGQHVLYVEARDVPSIGYRVFGVQPAAPAARSSSDLWAAGDCRLEGPFYAVTVSPITGGIVSLVDKLRGRELVDPNSPYHLNQCLCFGDGTEHTPRRADITIGSCGSVFGRLIVKASLKNTTVTTTVTLYASLDRVDLRNEVERFPTDERYQLDFAFPFLVPDRRYRFEAPGAIISPGKEQRPGAGQAVTAVRHFVDIFNDEAGVTLTQADSGLVEFGHRTSLEDPLGPDPSNSTVLALVMHNCLDWREITRDQGGSTHFCFRFSLRGHGGGFDPAAAVRFGWQDNNELLAVPLPGRQGTGLPAHKHSFAQAAPDSAILSCLKVAEEDGLLVRLWNCDEQGTSASVDVSGLADIEEARQTDLLERDKQALPVVAGMAEIPVAGRGFAAARLLPRKREGGDASSIRPYA